MGYESAFHLGRSESMTRYIQNVVESSHNPEVPILVGPSPVSSGVDPLKVVPVGFTVAAPVAVNSPEHGRPRLTNDQSSTLIRTALIALVIKNCSVYAEEGKGGCARLGWSAAGEW